MHRGATGPQGPAGPSGATLESNSTTVNFSTLSVGETVSRQRVVRLRGRSCSEAVPTRRCRAGLLECARLAPLVLSERDEHLDGGRRRDRHLAPWHVDGHVVRALQPLALPGQPRAVFERLGALDVVRDLERAGVLAREGGDGDRRVARGDLVDAAAEVRLARPATAARRRRRRPRPWRFPPWSSCAEGTTRLRSDRSRAMVEPFRSSAAMSVRRRRLNSHLSGRSRRRVTSLRDPDESDQPRSRRSTRRCLHSSPGSRAAPRVSSRAASPTPRGSSAPCYDRTGSLRLVAGNVRCGVEPERASRGIDEDSAGRSAPSGARGEAGPQGAPGDGDGATGSQGPQGGQGPPGPAGVAGAPARRVRPGTERRAGRHRPAGPPDRRENPALRETPGRRENPGRREPGPAGSHRARRDPGPQGAPGLQGSLGRPARRAGGSGPAAGPGRSCRVAARDRNAGHLGRERRAQHHGDGDRHLSGRQGLARRRRPRHDDRRAKERVYLTAAIRRRRRRGRRSVSSESARSAPARR